MSVPTSNIIMLASDGFRFAKLVKRGPFVGQYVGQESKSGATHKVIATYPKPYLDMKAPKGVFRVVYIDPKNGLDITGPDAKARAEAKLAEWKALALRAVPYSAVTVPIGQSYKKFCAIRTEAARNGSLYDKKKKEPAMKNKPAKPGNKPKASASKDSKNGMTRPKEGTTCRKVWDIADAKDGVRADVLVECSKRKINDATAMTQFGKWRVYHGLVGTRKAPAKVAKRKPAPLAKRKPAPPKRKPAAPKPAPTAETAPSA